MKNLKPIISFPLVLCLALNIASCGITPGSDDPSPTPEVSPSPAESTGDGDGGRTEPYIRVFAEFPSEPLTKSGVDIEYEAYPSDGATIIRVYYTINDGSRAGRTIYLAGDPERSELGKGRIGLQGGENTIVLTVEDSSGKSASFTVDPKPYVERGFRAPKTIRINYCRWKTEKAILLQTRLLYMDNMMSRMRK
jgi:hypothetical protein